MHRFPIGKHAAHALGAAALAACTGCAGAMGQQVAHDATPVAVQQSLRALNEDENRELIVRLLGSPEIEEASHRLAARITSGALAAMSDPERSDEIRRAADTFVVEISRAVAQSMRQQIAPEVVTMVVSTVERAMDRILGETGTAKLSAAVEHVTEASVRALARSLHDDMRPEIRAIIREDVAFGLRDAMADPEMQRVLGQTTRTIAKQAVLGTQDAFEEIDRRTKAGHSRETLLTRLQSLAYDSSNLMKYGVIGLGLFSVILALFLARTWTRARAARAEAEKREAALLALTTAIRSTEGQPWSPQLQELLDESFGDDERSAYLRELVRARRRAPQPPPEARPETRPDSRPDAH